MSFYKSIADYYDYIFPTSPMQVKFVGAHMPGMHTSQLLDVGCGTGNLTLALAPHCASIMGIDLDSEMLRLANAKTLPENVSFQKGNMLTLSDDFPENSFDGIVSFGNTLVHLDSLSDIEAFFKQCYSVLKPEGKLLLQIINYDRILNENMDHLPTIENDQIKFERIYEYLQQEHRINFKTILTNKSNNETIKNEQLLFPISEMELVRSLLKNGFEVLNRYGNFQGEKLGLHSIPLVIEAQKHP